MKKYILFLLSVLALTVFFGCSKPSVEEESQPSDNAVSWMTEGFAVTEKLEEGQTLWAGQFQPWEHNTTSGDYGVCEELLWYLGAEQREDPDSELEYVLEIYDTSLEKSVTKRFSRKELGLEEGLIYLDDMDMPDAEHYVFRWYKYEQDENGMYYQTADGMVYTDLAGTAESVNFWDFYLERGICQEEHTPELYGQYLNWRCDGKGNIGLVHSEYKEKKVVSSFYLLNRNGETILEYECAPEQSIRDILRTSEGELILSIYDEKQKCYEFMWADTAERKLRSLVSMKASYNEIAQIYGMLGDDLYYRSEQLSESRIVRWNVKSGRREPIFDLRAAGLNVGYTTRLALRDGKTPVLHLVKKGKGQTKEWLTVLTEQQPEGTGAIRVADLVGHEQVSACAVQASLETPNVRYEYEAASAQESRDRILAELSQGKGPELLFVSLEDMYMLEEKGLLLAMDELLPEDLREKLLPGALEIGTLEGKLKGVPVAVQAESLAVAADTWPESTWRLEDVIRLMEEGKLTGALRNEPGIMHGGYMEPYLTAIILIQDCLEDSFLIDWEKRKCHFDDERFLRLLKLVSTDLSNLPTDEEVWLNEGRDVLHKYFWGRGEFDSFAQMEKENGHLVGFPTEGDCGSYLRADGGVLVVNAGIENKEAAACFLETLLGEELQSKDLPMAITVRKLVPEDYIVEDESGRLWYMRVPDNPDNPRHEAELKKFQDGDTVIHRYAAFLERCKAAPRRYTQIRTILMEELSAMCGGGKSPEDTADSIQKRVQLYLDEGK